MTEMGQVAIWKIMDIVKNNIRNTYLKANLYKPRIGHNLTTVMYMLLQSFSYYKR
jgi:hypothetical protein